MKLLPAVAGFLAFWAQILALNLPAPAECDNAPTDAIAWFRAQNDATDSAGGHLATLDGATFGPGQVCRGFAFDGLGNRITVADAADLNFGPGENLSLEAWFRASATNRKSILSIIDKRDAPAVVGGIPFASAVGYSLFLQDGVPSFQFTDQPLGQATKNFRATAGDLRDDQWHHVVVSVTRSRSDGGRFYLDGVAVGTFDPTSVPGNTTNGEPLRLGNHASPTFDGFFAGGIDEVVLYRRALDAAEVTRRFQTGSAGGCCRNLAVTIEAPASIPAGTVFQTHVTLSARGPGTNDPVTVTQLLPRGVTVTGSRLSMGSLNVIGNTAVWRLGSLAGETNATLQLSLAPAPGSGRLTNSVSLTLAGDDESPEDNAASVVTTPYSGTCTTPTGLVGWWRGEGNALDSAGTNHGTFPNGAYAAGVSGRGFNFFDQGFVEIPDSPALNQTMFTLEAWVNPTIVDGEADIILNKESGLAAELIQYQLGIKGPLNLETSRVPLGNLMFFVGGLRNVPDEYSGWIDAGAPVPVGTWTHVALTVGPGQVRAYVNGVITRELNLVQGTPAAVAGSPLRFGARSTSPNGVFSKETFFGQIDEVSLYNRVLTPDEIMGLVEAGSLGKCPRDVSVAFVNPPASVGISSPLRLDLSVTNTGPGDAAGVVVTLPVPPGATFVNALTSVGTSSQFGGIVRFEIGSLPGGTGAALTLQLATADAATVLTNVATIVYGTPDALPDDDTATALVKVLAPTDCVAIPGIIGWWPGENNARDLVSTNHGTLSGGVTFGVGEVTNAFAFDGLTGRVTLGNPSAYHLQDLSIEAWIHRGSDSLVTLNGTGGFILAGDTGGYGLGLTDDGHPMFTQVGLKFVTANLAITDATNWHHLAVTKSGTQVTFYVDGAPAGTAEFLNVFVFARPFAIGALGGTARNTFLGAIDEPTLYNRPITAAEVASIFAAGPSGKCHPAPALVEEDCKISFTAITPTGATFTTTPGAKVVLESSTDLVTWKRFERLADAAGRVALPPPAAGESTLFYRIISSRCLVPAH